MGAIYRAVVVALVAVVTPLLDAQADREESAQRALDKAVEGVEQGKYKAAVAVYKQVVKRYPGTAAAAIAEQRSMPNALLGWAFVEKNGPMSNRVDVVAMGDGYTLDQQNALADFAKVVPKVFAKNKLLDEYQSYHNFLRAAVVSKDAGVDGFGREYDTALDGRVLPTVQGHVAVSHPLVKKMLAEIPETDGLAVVFVKRGSHGTGGGGVAVIGGRDDSTIVHEWGHAFGGLSDEYDQHNMNRGPVRSNTNLSDTDDPEKVPWRHFIDAKVPGVGVYRGGGGQLDGAWKPTNHCAMKDGMIFCPVCREELVLRIYALVDPIDGCDPPAHPTLGKRGQTVEPDKTGVYRFEVQIMQPESHGLEVQWYLLNEQEVPAPAREEPLRDRRRRGVLNEITVKPVKSARSSRKRVQTYSWRPPPDASGRYRVICRVRDGAQPSGQARPWVLRDEYGLLESERGWWIDVPGRGEPDK